MQNHSDATVEYLRTLAKKQKNIMMPLWNIYLQVHRKKKQKDTVKLYKNSRVQLFFQFPRFCT